VQIVSYSFPRALLPCPLPGSLKIEGRPSRLAVVLALLLFLLAFGNRPAQTAEAGSPAEIVLGMSTVLTGDAKDIGQDMQMGILAGLERANRTGGVQGRKLRLITLDDGFEPARTAPNMRQLMEKENVLGIIGNAGGPSAAVAVPMANEQKTLLFAAFSGGTSLRSNPPDRYVMNFRASYAEETAVIIDALIGTAGMKPEEIAFFTQKGGTGDAGYTRGMIALQSHGLTDPNLVLHVGYERNTLAVEGAVARILMAESPPRAVVMVGTYPACAKFIKLCRISDLNPLFVCVSFVGSNSLAKEIGKSDARIIATQVVPYPSDDNVPIVHEYQADLHSTNPSASAGFGDLEGYIAARILILALEKYQSRFISVRRNTRPVIEFGPLS
jgi:branched-chain amino acid transport system substrate-binding protein